MPYFRHGHTRMMPDSIFMVLRIFYPEFGQGKVVAKLGLLLALPPGHVGLSLTDPH